MFLGVVLLSNILLFSGSSPCRNLFCPVRTPKKLKKASMKLGTTVCHIKSSNLFKLTVY